MSEYKVGQRYIYKDGSNTYTVVGIVRAGIVRVKLDQFTFSISLPTSYLDNVSILMVDMEKELENV